MPKPSRSIGLSLHSTALAMFLIAIAVPGHPHEDQSLSARFGVVHGDPGCLVELGSAWNRYDFSWSGIEREMGVFDFRDLPAQVDASLEVGVHILPILDYEPAWDPQRSPADNETLELWDRYVERTVAEFKGKLQYWQAWNEPNISFWKPKPNPRDYAELLRHTYIAAKKADPTVQILGMNCSDIDLEFTEAVFRYGGLNYCDVLAYQPYRIAPEVGHFEEMQALRILVDRFGEQRPIWFTEMGWNTDHLPFADAKDLYAERPMRRQAAFLVRYMAVIMATGVEKIFWFAQSAGGHGLVMRRPDGERLSYFAYRHLIERLDDTLSIREITPRGAFGIYAFLSSGRDHSELIAWSVNGPQTLPLPESLTEYELRSMLGDILPVPQSASLPLTAEPVYLVFKETPDAILERGSLAISPAKLWLEPDSQQQLSLTWNPLTPDPNPKSFKIITPPRIKVSPGRIRLASGETATIAMNVSRHAVPGRFPIHIHGGNSTWTVELIVTPRKLWEYKAESEGLLTPTLLSEPDSTTSILIAAYDSPDILALSNTGELQWRYRESEPINDRVVAADTNGDARPEIIAAMPGEQTIFTLSSDGVLQWRKKLSGAPSSDRPGWHWTHPLVADLNGDRLGEIIYADREGVVTCLAGDREMLWSTKISEHRCDLPVCIADINQDTKPEILAGDTAGMLHCLTSEGANVWNAGLATEITAAPVVATVEPNGSPSIFVVTHAEKLFRLNSAGYTIWTAELGGTADLGCGIVPADLNADGKQEILVSTRNHEVLCFDASGLLLWRTETGAQIRSTPAVGDVDGDGSPEILIGSADWLLYCLGPDGTVEWTCNTGNRIDASPLLADLTGDNRPDIILPVRGGKIAAFSITTPRSAFNRHLTRCPR